MSSIGEFLEVQRDRIAEVCAERAEGFESAKGLKKAELLDGLPALLSGFAAVLKKEDPGALERLLDTHVANRLRQGFGVEDVVGEISLVVPSIFRVWSEAHPTLEPPFQDVVEVSGVLQHAAAEAVSKFTLHLLEDEQTEKRYSRLLERIASETFVEKPGGSLRSRLPEILQLVRDAMKADAAWLFLKSPDTDALTVVAAVGERDPQVGYSTSLGADTLAAALAASEEPTLIPDLKLTTQLSPALRASSLRSAMGARVWTAGRLLGVLQVGFKEARSSAGRAGWRIETLAGRLALLLEEGRLWEALKEKNERLQLALHSGGIGIWEFNPQTGLLIWDEYCKAFWGLPPHAAVDFEVFLSGIHPEDRGWVRDLVEQGFARHAESLTLQYRTVGLEDHVERWIETQARILFDSAGKAVRAIGVMRDVSAARIAHEKLRTSEERLRRAEQVAAVAAQLTGFHTYEYLPQTGEMIWSEQKRLHFGLSPGAPVDYQVFLEGIHPDDRDRMHRRIQAVLKGEEGGEYLEVFRTIGIEDGVERWLESRGKVFFDEQGRPVRLIGGGVEITDRKRLDELRDRLFGIVGHDLRNPLNAIKMAAASLGKSLPEKSKLVSVIDRSADRMSRMIYQLLDFTRVRFAAGVALEPEPADLVELCREVVAEAELSSPGRIFRVGTDGDTAGAWDAGRLSEALSNLVGNAVEHGSPQTSIELRVRGEGDEVVFSIHNEGPPIPEEWLPVLFDPFRRVHLPRASSGLGLGLYITREIVRAHGGEIDVRSTASEGTTFTVRLPRTVAPGLRGRHPEPAAHEEHGPAVH